MINRFRAGLLVAATVGALGITAVVAGSAGATTTSFTGSTAVSNRSDSGANGNWAMDNFTRNATIVFHGLTVQSHCPGIGSGLSCYSWTGNIKDNGTFTTVPGDNSPGQGSLNGGSPAVIGTAVTGPMSGTYKYVFYTDQNASSVTSSPPATLTGDSPSTGTWVEQFFTPGAVNFWNSTLGTGTGTSLGTTGGWTYTATFGADTACPMVASRWVDASASNWGGNPSDGNILAPDAAHC